MTTNTKMAVVRPRDFLDVNAVAGVVVLPFSA